MEIKTERKRYGRFGLELINLTHTRLFLFKGKTKSNVALLNTVDLSFMTQSKSKCFLHTRQQNFFYIYKKTQIVDCVKKKFALKFKIP